MKNIKLFEREINLIVDEDLRMAVKSYMEEAVPAYFWTDGASSSGKYHPQFAQGEGGLVRVEFEDGVYENLISGEAVEVFRGMLSSNGLPVILRNF